MLSINDVSERIDTKANVKNLIGICNYICLYYSGINEELLSIKNILKATEIACISSYTDSSFIKWHIENTPLFKELIHLNNIASRLDSIGPGLKQEFFQNIDFLNIKDIILSIEDRKDIIPFIFDAQKVIENILYQVNRIKSSNSISEKSVAILKEMIAYY